MENIKQGLAISKSMENIKQAEANPHCQSLS
jgi:hypothetical protein